MTADQLLNGLFNASLSVSIIATVLSLGMSFKIAQLVAPLKRVWLVIIMVLMNVLVIPAAAWGIAKLFGLPDDTVTGITLVAIGAAGPSGLKVAQLARRADIAFAVAMVVVLQLVNLVTVPLWAGLVVTGATISTWAIAKDLLLLLLLPLVVGLVIKARYPDNATEWQPDLVKVANIALWIAIVTGIAVNLPAIVALLGSLALLASVVIAVVSLGLGYLIGGKDPATRLSAELISGTRFGSLGLIIIGTQLGGNPAFLGPAIVYSLVGMLVGMFVALELGRRAGAANTAVTTSQETT